MKRIDSSNARPNINGTGKTGFHDNADLAGQDATYLTPEWLNIVQEELANLLEKRNIQLNAESSEQLFNALAGQDDLTELANLIQEQLNKKYDKTGGTISGDVNINANLTANNVSTTHFEANSSKTNSLTVEEELFFGDYRIGDDSYTRLPNGFIMQFGFIPYANNNGNLSDTATGEKAFDLVFPKPFDIGLFFSYYYYLYQGTFYQ